ncbi:MAG: hypothetical protein OXU20_42890 [Myxococcales bacterium]|nr:hypothetical protein [Myxococcales bacterium]
MKTCMSTSGRACRASARRSGFALAIVFVAAAALGSLRPTRVASQDHNFAGSVQTNYLWVATDPDAREQTFDGFTNELSLKVAVDFSDAVSANIKLCYGCHGVELGMAFTDLRVLDELNFRAGRFSPSFGDFPLRHDPANHLTADKPLPYDMGRMLRLREFNLSVLPAPYVDQGLEINGTHWFGDYLQLDYAAYLIGGLRGGQDAVDVDFMESRQPYYVDNNSEPAVGGRAALTWDATPDMMFTVGASGMAGHYDPKRELEYVLLGADLYARLYTLNLHAEYLVRRTQMALGDDPDSRFRYGPGGSGEYDDFFVKDGFYVEGNLPVTRRLELVARFDGLRRLGNVTINSPLRSRSVVLRYTAGVNVVFDGSVRLKVSGEVYDFSDFDDEVAANVGFVAAF